MTRERIVGRNAIREALRHSSSRIHALYLARGEGSGSFLREIQPLLDRCHIQPEWISPDMLSELSEGRAHQGCVAELTGDEASSFPDLLVMSKTKSHSLVVIADSIFDPQNLGAMLRASECFGADALVYSKNRGAPMTPAVSKASAGASTLIPSFAVSNLAQTVEKLKENGYWIVASCMTEDSVAITDFAFPEKTALIMGSEGDGIQPLLMKRADFRVNIPLFGKIQSLNVSQATTVFLYQYRMVHGK